MGAGPFPKVPISWAHTSCLRSHPSRRSREATYGVPTTNGWEYQRTWVPRAPCTQDLLSTWQIHPLSCQGSVGHFKCLYLYKTSHQPLCKLQKKAISQIKPDLETTLRFYFESQKFWSSWTSKNKAAYMSAYKARFNMIPVIVQRMFLWERRGL